MQRPAIFSTLAAAAWLLTAGLAEAATSASATSTKGRSVTLSFDVSPVTTDTVTATLCSSPASAILQAKLWMPEMGHGSSPTRVTPTTAGCVRIDDIDFFMGGAWQILVGYGDGDQATLAVAVQG